MKWYHLLASLLLVAACGTDPQPINYGNDACSFCQMTIVDRQHSAQIVTEKGKSYKYDAIECMLRDYQDWNRPNVAHFLVADYANPGSLTDASDAFYLISQNIPSPMGEFLTAFSSEETRQVHIDSSGEALEWESLRKRFQGHAHGHSH